MPEAGREDFNSRIETGHEIKAGLIRLSVLALDYDGTIAINGVLDPAARDAVITVRRQGFYVILVTGRRLAELNLVLGNLDLFDAVVAENGAVVWYPALRRSTLTAQPPSPILFQELR